MDEGETYSPPDSTTLPPDWGLGSDPVDEANKGGNNCKGLHFVRGGKFAN